MAATGFITETKYSHAANLEPQVFALVLIVEVYIIANGLRDILLTIEDIFERKLKITVQF